VAAPATYVQRVRVHGRVGPAAGSEAKLAFALSGIVASVDVRVGERVSAGQLLARLDARGLALDAAQARDDAAAAAAAYGNGRVARDAVAGALARDRAARAHAAAVSARETVDARALERAQTLFAGGVLAQKDVDAARTQLEADANERAQANAEIAQAAADLSAARTSGPVAAAQAASAQAKAASVARTLANAAIVAPRDGVIAAILKTPGEAVDSSQPAIVLSPAGTNVLTLVAGGNDAGLIRAGDPVSARLANGARGSGVVIAVTSGVDSATQTSTVVVNGAPAGARSGESVEATIDVAKRRGIVIPTSAIVEDPQSGNAVVFVRKSDGFAARTVVVAASDETSSLLASGLKPGERFASEGAFDLLAPSGGG
jgi:cobalt-zinc-cadmium efflux system membrane fusion protein